MIKLFRDIEIDGKSGGDGLITSINNALDKHYNQGIDHAIKVVELNRDTYWSKNSHDRTLVKVHEIHNGLIKQLESLKKKQS